jgi:hypothetical protein
MWKADDDNDDDDEGDAAAAADDDGEFVLGEHLARYGEKRHFK